MKVKLFVLTADTDAGTSATVFATEDQLHQHMRQIILDDFKGYQGDSVMETGGKLTFRAPHHFTRLADRLLELLNSGETEAAFLKWFSNHPRCGAYTWDSQDIELPSNPIDARNAAFVAEFLALFGPYVAEHKGIPGDFAVDRIVEYVIALKKPL